MIFHYFNGVVALMCLGGGTKVVEYITQELELITWSLIINGFGICYMLNICVCCLVISA